MDTWTYREGEPEYESDSVDKSTVITNLLDNIYKASAGIPLEKPIVKQVEKPAGEFLKKIGIKVPKSDSKPTHRPCRINITRK